MARCDNPFAARAFASHEEAITWAHGRAIDETLAHIRALGTSFTTIVKTLDQ